MAKKYEDIGLFVDNQKIYNFYYDRICQVALSQFQYGNLPSTCDRWFFEWKAMRDGQAALCVPDGSRELMSLGFVPYLDEEQTSSGQMLYNAYGYPTGIKGIGWADGDVINGQTLHGAGYQVTTHDFIVMYDNMGRMSMMGYIDLYARLLWECHMIIRSNQKFQNIPYLVKASKDSKQSVDNFFQDLWNFKPVIELNNMGKKAENIKDANSMDIDALDLRVDYKVIDMWKALKITWAEAMSMLGITTQFTKKSQYENSDQLEMDKMGDDLSLCNRLMRRVELCNRANERWGGTEILPKGDLYVNLSPMTEEFAKATQFPMDMVVATLQQMDGGAEINSNNQTTISDSYNNNQHVQLGKVENR